MKKYVISILLSIFFLGTIGKGISFAQVYKFELVNPTQPILQNSDFQVKILINTNGIPVLSGDAIVIFDPTKMSITGVQKGDFFNNFSESLLGGFTNKYYVAGYEYQGQEKKTSTDAWFATINLKAVSCGSAPLTFECTPGSGNDSNISRASDSQDIINCSGLSPLSVTLCGGTAGTPTITPTKTVTPTGPTSSPAPTSVPVATSTPIPTSTPRPTATIKPTSTPRAGGILPTAGAVEDTVKVLGAGTALVGAGSILLLILMALRIII